MTQLGLATFIQANNVSNWNPATDGQSWSVQSGAATLSISSNEGLATGVTALTYVELGSSTSGDGEVLCRMSVSSTNYTAYGLVLRATGTTTFYRARINSNTAGVGIGIVKTVSGTSTDLVTAAFTASINTFYFLRFRLVGSNLWVKVWASGTAEPNTWNVTISDTSITGAGGFGICINTTSSGDTAKFDSFYAVDYIWSDSIPASDIGALQSWHVDSLTAADSLLQADSYSTVDALAVADAVSYVDAFLPTVSYPALIAAANPVVYYRLDESSGTIAHDSSNAYNGTLPASGITYSQPGAIVGSSDTAMLFGAFSTLSLPYTVNPSTWSALTLEFWIKLTGNWQHIVVTCNSTATTIYLNGAVYTSGTGDPVVIDQDIYYAGSYNSGDLDEVAVYSYVLSASQIQAHYQLGQGVINTTDALSASDMFSSIDGTSFIDRLSVLDALLATDSFSFIESVPLSDSALSTDSFLPVDAAPVGDIGNIQSWHVDALSASDVLSSVDGASFVDGLTILDALLAVDGSQYIESVPASDATLSVDSFLPIEAAPASDIGAIRSWNVDSLVAVDSLLAIDGASFIDANTVADSLLAADTALPIDANTVADSLFAIDTANLIEAAPVSDIGAIQQWNVDALTIVDALLAIDGSQYTDQLSASDASLNTDSMNAVDALSVADTAQANAVYLPVETALIGDALLSTDGFTVVDANTVSDTVQFAALGLFLDTLNILDSISHITSYTPADNALSAQDGLLNNDSYGPVDVLSIVDALNVTNSANWTDVAAISDALLATDLAQAIDVLSASDSIALVGVLTAIEALLAQDRFLSTDSASWVESIPVSDPSVQSPTFVPVEALSAQDSFFTVTTLFSVEALAAQDGLLRTDTVLWVDQLSASDLFSWIQTLPQDIIPFVMQAIFRDNLIVATFRDGVTLVTERDGIITATYR